MKVRHGIHSQKRPVSSILRQVCTNILLPRRWSWTSRSCTLQWQVCQQRQLFLAGTLLRLNLLWNLWKQPLLALNLVGDAVDGPGSGSSWSLSLSSVNLPYNCLAFSQMVLVSRAMFFLQSVIQRANADSILTMTLLQEVTSFSAVLLKVTLAIALILFRHFWRSKQ